MIDNDFVPTEVYDLIAKLLISDGHGDAEIYKVYSAIKDSWPEKQEKQ